MITEKQIEKHRFFTTDGTDMWMRTKVKTMMIVDIVNCETGEKGTLQLGEPSASVFVPVIMPKVKPAAAVIRTKKTAGKKKKAKGGRGVRPGSKPSSQYLGVTVRTAKGGKLRYYAQSNRGGKFTGLDSHDVEELAAAAVQDHLGNNEEATRLRMLAKKKTGPGQAKAPATKGPEEVEHKSIFAQESPDE